MAGRARRFFSNLADAFIPGNAYNSNTGRWNPATTRTGIAGVIADQFIPGGSNIVGTAARGGLFGSEFARNLRNEGIYNDLADQYGDFREQLANEHLRPGVQVGGPNPQVTVGQPQFTTGGPSMPGGLFDSVWQQNTNQAQQGMDDRMAQEQQRIQNSINGQGATNMGAVSARPIGGELSFGNGHFNNGVGAGTGYGASSYANDGWGQTALGFGIGASAGGSGGNIALSDAQKAARLNADGAGFAGRWG